MASYLPSLLIVFSIGFASAQPRPRVKASRAFAHAAEAGKGKSDKAQFRHESTRPTVDLHPHKLETFKTTKARHHYKFKNSH